MNTNLKLDMAAFKGEVVTQAHSDYCEANSHAGINGVWCHRCGASLDQPKSTSKQQPELFTRISGHYYGLIDVRTIDSERYALGWETPVSGDDLARYKAMVAAA